MRGLGQTSPAGAIWTPATSPQSAPLDPGFLTDSGFAGIPNWILIGADLLALSLLGGKR